IDPSVRRRIADDEGVTVVVRQLVGGRESLTHRSPDRSKELLILRIKLIDVVPELGLRRTFLAIGFHCHRILPVVLSSSASKSTYWRLVSRKGHFYPASSSRQKLASQRRIYNRLHAPDFAVVQHHFDAVRVCGTFGEDAGHDALRQCARALVLLLHDLHAQPRANFTAYRHTHSFSVSCLYGARSDPIIAAANSPDVATTRTRIE